MSETILTRLQSEKTPLINGGTVTFVWQGERAPRLMADFNAWEEGGGTEMQLAGPGLWTLSFELPEDAYVEYAFLEGEERLNDPLNPRKVTNGMGKYNNYFAMPAYRRTPYTRPIPGLPRGTVTREVLDAGPFVAGGRRPVYFYQPPVAQPCPLLVVWDGQDYYRRARLTTILDRLIHAGRIRPVALAMPEHGRQARLLEYGCAEITLGFLDQVVLPRARQCLNLLDLQQHPGAYGVMGASMGGLMSLYAGLRMPGVFGQVLSQSGAFSFPGHDFVVWDLARHADPARHKLWLDCGTMEFLTEANRRMAALLGQLGYDFVYHEYQGGHNYSAWRSDLVAGLEWLFPPETA